MLNICIQNLGKYNEGELLFHWLTLPATEEEISKALDKIKICHTDEGGEEKWYGDCFGQPYEEMHIPDWECDIDGIEYNEWASIEYYNEIAEKLDELDDVQKHWISAYMEERSCSFDDALDEYEDNSRWWEGWSKSDVAREMADDNMACMIPSRTGYGCDSTTKAALEWMQQYFDYDAYERNLDLYETDNGVIETF